jgi:hypothetical protein
MDQLLLRQFKNQVLLQCHFLLMAADDLNSRLNDLNTNFRGDSAEKVFYALQNLLNAAANISKVLWGQGGKLAAQRKDIRDSIGVSDSSTLRLMGMRNNFEHFDERLDHWWNNSQGHNYVDLCIASRNEIHVPDILDWFRVFNPTTADITF